MKGTLSSLPLAFKMIFKDPINLVLAIIPTLIALAIYLFTVVTIYRNSDRFVSMFRGYIYTAEQATLLAKIMTAVLMIFVFFLMSWTFVVVVGIIAAPFNSMLSSRIEKKLTGNVISENKDETFKQISKSIGQTFKNEFKKIILILFVGGVAFLMQFFPLLYPVGLFLVAVLLAVQFVDYSWSRHDLHFGSCLKDVFLNIFPYTASGFVFLILISVPLVNTVVPALATSYYTVLWLNRQNKIPQSFL
jgi:CysZ protein